MGMSPDNGKSNEENEESDEFLSGVAAESVNDAILILGELRSGASAAMPHLKLALELLVSHSHIQPADGETSPASDQQGAAAKLTLSPMAIDLIVEKRLQEMESGGGGLGRKRRRAAPKEQCDAVAKAKQQALMYMIEALGILDSINDEDAIPHLQLAIDRISGNPSSALSRDFLSELAKQQRH
ncbi:hypothetical protein DFR49_0846 [Hephaestia caeni]|uniref:Uncharacterized protein n=1 Tax=Hephaestia caeni TaxID=645617 RepID=A0A397PBH9_9SPHN|nr:hypothetical protein [Hephaestia caeni]RIA46308.1 hypothetical protein DFR49_0846 [Hephaestia caeni]